MKDMLANIKDFPNSHPEIRKINIYEFAVDKALSTVFESGNYGRKVFHINLQNEMLEIANRVYFQSEKAALDLIKEKNMDFSI